MPPTRAQRKPDEITQLPAAKLKEAGFWAIPWFHHVILMQKVKDLPTRHWYMAQTLANGWSRNVRALQIDVSAHARQGQAVSNFATVLPAPQSDLVQQTLKDPYIFDFLTLTEKFLERELETELIRHLEKFLLELGQGFAFVGRQHRLTVGDAPRGARFQRARHRRVGARKVQVKLEATRRSLVQRSSDNAHLALLRSRKQEETIHAANAICCVVAHAPGATDHCRVSSGNTNRPVFNPMSPRLLAVSDVPRGCLIRVPCRELP